MSFDPKLAVSAALAVLLAGTALAQESGAEAPAAAPETATEAPSEGSEAEPAPEAAPETTAEAAPEVTYRDDVTADTVVATVNGQTITVGHMIVMRARLPEQYQQLPNDMLFSGILDQLVQQLALAGEGTELSKGSELALENERRSFLAGEALSGVGDAAVAEDALQKLYEERFAGAEPTKEYSAAHILVETEEEAKAIKAEIDGGADFAEVATAKSTGPSGPNGGDLGWFESGMMVEPFEKAVMAMEPGQISDPVQTQFGWHVIRLNEVRMKEAPKLEDVRAELEQELRQQAMEAAIEAATAAAAVERSAEGIDPNILGELSLVQD